MNSFVIRCRQFLGELNLHSLRKLMIAILGGSMVLAGEVPRRDNQAIPE
jgi:hypothetical protein